MTAGDKLSASPNREGAGKCERHACSPALNDSDDEISQNNEEHVRKGDGKTQRSRKRRTRDCIDLGLALEH